MSRQPQWFRLGLGAWSLGIAAASVVALDDQDRRRRI